MDIKIFRNIYILHLIDHVTRFSAAAIIKSRERERQRDREREIIKNILKIWISIYGPPSKYFSDNGGEFSNTKTTMKCVKYCYLRLVRIKIIALR